MIYGYHRTSTREQHLDRGIEEISNFCSQNKLKLQKIYLDQHTGKNFNRPRYVVLRDDILREGDTLILTEVDRLGRNKVEILEQLRILKNKKVRVMILEIPTTLIDLSTLEETMAKMIIETINNMLIEVYAAMAQAEIMKKEKRQREGIAAMKERGEWEKYGRPVIMSQTQFAEAYKNVEDGNIRPFELMKQLGMKKSTFYKYRNELLRKE